MIPNPYLKKKWLQRCLLIFPLALVVALGWIAFQIATEFKSSFVWVAHTYEVLNVLEETLSDLKDAELAQRDYLFTGQEDYLDHYNSAGPEIRAKLARLKRLTADNSFQQKNVRELETLTEKKTSICG